MDPQRLFQLRKAAVMPDQASVTASAGGRELVRQRNGGQQQRFPDHASYIRYLRGVNYVRTRNVAPPVPSTTVPGAPTAVSATAGDAQAIVTFTAPASNGGAAITSYTVTSSPDGITATGSASPITITGLTNGTAYTFTVVATNSVGPSAPSSASAPVTPVTTPSAPSIISITPENGQVSVAFTPPVSNGGSAITNYKYSTDNGISWTARATPSLLSPLLITGLTNGTTYQIKLLAVNALGDGAASTAASATPATTPSAPTGLSATVGSGEVTIAFTPPASDGGSAITNYEYSTNNGSSWTAQSPTSTSSPVTIIGLANGTTYQVKLRAVNEVGVGTASAAVSATTPSGPPSPPTALVGIGGNQAIYVLFTAGANGGSPITNYEYSIDGGSTFTPFSPAQTESPFIISGGLSNGTSYSVQFKAVNSAGTGSASETVTVTPTTNTLASSGRLIHLDANNSSSYSGTGSTWTNLDSAGSYSAALLNAPTFNTSDKYFTFNGTNQIAQIAAATAINPTINSAFTLQIWARVNTTSTNFGSGDGLISKQYGASSYDGYSLGLLTDTSLYLKMNGGGVDGTYYSGTGAFSNGWALYTIVVRFRGGSSNPSYVYTSTRRVVTGINNEFSIPSNDAPIQFPRGLQESTFNYCPADVGAFYVYNTALSHEDIIRNYDATKSRYGL